MIRIFFLLLLPLPALAQLPVDKPIAVYLLAGQSNMAGRGTPDYRDSLAHPRVFALDRAGRIVPAREPLHWDKPSAGVGPGLAFGRAMAEADTTHTVVLVPAAVGGTSIDLWRPGAYDTVTNTHPYDDALDRVADVLERGGTLKGIIWHQGESDSRMDRTAGYRDKLVALVARFRKDLNAPDLPFVAGELLPRNQLGRPAEIINRAINESEFFIDNFYVVRAEPMDHKGDRLHFDAGTARRLGRAYAEAMGEMIKARSQAQH